MIAETWSSVAKYAALSMATYLSIKTIGTLVRSKVLIPMFTVLPELSGIGKPRNKEKLPGEVVVCGGSIGGLFAAAVASKHYESVLVIEREEWVVDDGTELRTGKEAAAKATGDGTPININPRTRVMQYMSSHVLQPVVYEIMRQLFPQYEEEVAALGLRHHPHDVAIHDSGVPLASRSPKDPHTLYTSREVFEVLLQRLVRKACPNVRFMAGTVTGVDRSSDASSIREVHVRPSNGSPMSLKNPSLIIDSTGSSQAGFKWLKKCGYDLPDDYRIHYNPRIRYLTFQFTVPPHLRSVVLPQRPWDDTTAIYTYMPNLSRESNFFAMSVVDNDKVVVLCGGWGLDEGPCSMDEVKYFISTFPATEPIPEYVFNILDKLAYLASQLNPIVSPALMTSCSYIMYHQVAPGCLPSNFIAIGDSAMQLDPVFGQGVGKCAVGAACLDTILRSTETTNNGDVSRRFFKLQANRMNVPWTSTKEIDYGLQTTVPVKGEGRSTGWFSRGYGDYLLKAAHKDPRLALILWGARGWLLPPTDLFLPSIVMKVAWLWLTGQ
ncbi:hypothetical protein FRC02_006917 [Tulasnella sp. 418]|nr:hypothetical protein FRC02_006917 [Tulasnella sp. 418]